MSDVYNTNDCDTYLILYFHLPPPLPENLKELQEEFQTKTADLMKERERVSELSEECELLRNQITEILANKQRKIKENLFEVKVQNTHEF